jgi:hypothetical protein
VLLDAVAQHLCCWGQGVGGVVVGEGGPRGGGPKGWGAVSKGVCVYVCWVLFENMFGFERSLYDECCCLVVCCVGWIGAPARCCSLILPAVRSTTAPARPPRDAFPLPPHP